MKAPDKICVAPHQIFDYDLDIQEVGHNGAEEYIRKDALMEWLEQNRAQAQMWFDKYYDREDLSAKQVWEEVIGKLNEM